MSNDVYAYPRRPFVATKALPALRFVVVVVIFVCRLRTFLPEKMPCLYLKRILQYVCGACVCSSDGPN